MLSLLLDRSGDPRRRAALASFLLLACFGCEASLRAQVPPSWMPSPQPTARAYHKLAFDTARQRLVMFGGSSPGLPACHDETWERQATDWQRVPTSSPPPGRCDHAMAYDPVRRNTVVFGGSTSIGPLGDTWTWDGVEWAHIPAGPAPSPRYWHAMAWDAARSKVLLFGGLAGG
jgi:hypothetical protein